MSSARFKQLVWLAIIIIVLFVAFYVINCMLPSGTRIGKVSRIVELLIDPGTFANMPHDAAAHGELDVRTRIFEFFITISGAVLFTGVMISILSNMLDERVEAFKSGLLRYDFSGHILILGANEMLANMIRSFVNNPEMCKKDIVILTDMDVEQLHAQLRSEMDNSDLKNVCILFGNRNSFEELKSICVSQAEQIYIIGENNEIQHDSMNISCLAKVEILCLEREKPMKCFMVIDNLSSYHVFHFRTQEDEERMARLHYNEYMKQGEGKGDIADLSSMTKLQLTVINAMENWAQQVLVSRRFKDIIYPPIDRGGIGPKSEARVHFIVVGMTQMALNMATTVAHIAHYPNFKDGDERTRTKITFICNNIEQEMNFFKGHYSSLMELSHASYYRWKKQTDSEGRTDYKLTSTRHKPNADYGDFLDVEWQFVDGGIETNEVRKLLEYWCTSKKYENDIITMAICGKEPTENIAASLYLPRVIYSQNIPVFVYQPKMGNILEQAHNTEYFKNIYPFGMAHDCYDPSLQQRLMRAKKIHYVYEHYDSDKPIPHDSEQLDKLWYGIPFAKKISNIYAANSISSKLRSLNLEDEFIPCKYLERSFTNDEVEIMARVEHSRWNMEKLLVGFRAIKPEFAAYLRKSENKAEKDMYKEKMFMHTDICAYDKLTEGSKDFDKAIVRRLFDVIRE